MKKTRQHQDEAVKEMMLNNEGIINLPTGTGKTMVECVAIHSMLDEAWTHARSLDIDEDDECKDSHVPVFVLLSPRILLSNQLLFDVWEHTHQSGIDAQYMFVHSGGTADKRENMWLNSIRKSREESLWGNLPHRQLESTTSPIAIKTSYSKARRENVPLIISGTYDSANRIVASGIPIFTIFCDEAHNLVNEEFNWIASDDSISVRKYYLTATMKETVSDAGLGMNNSNVFGPILYRKSPVEMITAGEIIRPRMHLVDITDVPLEALDADINAIIAGFKEHRYYCQSGAKMLVVTKGSEHLNDIMKHPKMIELMDSRPNLTVFDVTTKYNAKINGVVVKRDVFLDKMKSMKDHEDAIILHIKILTEGIDVPGITGIMPMNNMKLSEFMQTLGRPSRLHPDDRRRLYDGTMGTDETDLTKYVKPYAWIILPVYGHIGIEMRANMQNMIYALRSYGFIAAEHVFIRQSKGSVEPKEIGGINGVDKKAKTYLNEIMEVVHEVELEEKASEFRNKEFRFGELVLNETMDETIIGLNDE